MQGDVIYGGLDSTRSEKSTTQPLVKSISFARPLPVVVLMLLLTMEKQCLSNEVLSENFEKRRKLRFSNFMSFYSSAVEATVDDVTLHVLTVIADFDDVGRICAKCQSLCARELCRRSSYKLLKKWLGIHLFAVAFGNQSIY